MEELGPPARAATPAQAAAAGDLVVVSIPPRAYLAVPAQPLAGKPVLDTINYMPRRDGRIPELDDGQRPKCGPGYGTMHSSISISGMFIRPS